MPPKVRAFLVIGFFLGFPLAGLVFVWKYAHVKIEQSADTVAQSMATDVLKTWDSQLLDDLGTFELRKSGAPVRIPADKAKFGKFESLAKLQSLGSAVGERGDTIWQMVKYEGDAKFEKGDAKLKLTLARRTINKEWLIESFELVPR